MGNRALTGAVKTLFAKHPRSKGRFKEIILTMPDIDRVGLELLENRCEAGHLIESGGPRGRVAAQEAFRATSCHA